MVTDLSGGTNTPPLGAGGLQGMLYGYDQLNRIRWARSLTGYNASSGFAARPTGAQAYDSRYSYDANGNLLTQLRHDGAAAVQDNFNYQYYAGTNRLLSVRPDSEVYGDKVFSSGAVPASNKPYANISLQNQAYVATGTNVKLQATQSVRIKSAFSIQGGSSLEIDKAEGGTYKYDAIGNLIRDEQEGTNIIWNVYGKIKQVDKADGSRLEFVYDAAGNRIAKKVTKGGSSSTTHYLRDATGNVMGIYQDQLLEEQPLYGLNRLGSYKGGRLVGERRLGLKHYELSNHLGNVLATVSDNISLSATETLAKTLSTTDYHPFGLQMEGRTFSSTGYRYGFNGKEKDAEGMGGGGSTYDYGFRIYNPRIAKFLSVDPLSSKYPFYTPYQFAGNNPIAFIDIDGLEPGNPAWPVGDGNKNDINTSVLYGTPNAHDNEDQPSDMSILGEQLKLSALLWATEAAYENLDGNNAFQRQPQLSQIGSYYSDNPWMLNLSNTSSAAAHKEYTNMHSTFEVSNEGLLGSEQNVVNLLLGHYLNGTGPENWVFSANGQVSNYLRNSAIVSDAKKR